MRAALVRPVIKTDYQDHSLVIDKLTSAQPQQFAKKSTGGRRAEMLALALGLGLALAPAMTVDAEAGVAHAHSPDKTRKQTSETEAAAGNVAKEHSHAPARKIIAPDEAAKHAHTPMSRSTLSSSEWSECEKTLCLDEGIVSQSTNKERCLALKEAGYPCEWLPDGGESLAPEPAHCSHLDKCATNFTRFCAHNVAGWNVDNCDLKQEL
jgi:hypothetical protein